MNLKHLVLIFGGLALFVVFSWGCQQNHPTAPQDEIAPYQSVRANVSVTGTPSNRYPSANIDSDNDGQINFIMEPNLWNITSGNGQITMTWSDASGLSVDIDLSNITQEDPDGWVHAYPEIWYGAKAWNSLGPANDGPISLPARLGQMNDFQTTVSYSVTRTDQHYNFPLETWLTRSTSRGSVSSNEVELMIWLDYQGMQGAGSVVGSLTTGGRSYNIWRSGAVGNGNWEYFAFVPTSPTRSGTVTFTWAPFIQAAQSYSDRANWQDLYFTAVEVGTEFGTPDYLQTSLAWTLSRLSFATTSNPMLGGGGTTTTTTSATTSTTTTAGTTTTTAAGNCNCGTCNWYGFNVPACCTQTTGWGWEDGGCNRTCVGCETCINAGQTCTNCTLCGGATTTTTTAATTSTTTTSATTSTTTTAATTSTTTTSGGGETCSPVDAEISAPFTQNGAGEYCWTATSCNYINSWNLSSLTINGVDFTNKYAFGSNLPAKIDGKWYIHYEGNYGWSHFELR